MVSSRFRWYRASSKNQILLKVHVQQDVQQCKYNTNSQVYRKVQIILARSSSIFMHRSIDLHMQTVISLTLNFIVSGFDSYTAKSHKIRFPTGTAVYKPERLKPGFLWETGTGYFFAVSIFGYGIFLCLCSGLLMIIPCRKLCSRLQ